VEKIKTRNVSRDIPPWVSAFALQYQFTQIAQQGEEALLWSLVNYVTLGLFPSPSAQMRVAGLWAFHNSLAALLQLPSRATPHGQQTGVHWQQGYGAA